MRRSLHRLPESPDDLQWIEDRLRRARRRFSSLVKVWLGGSGLFTFLALVNADGGDPAARIVPFLMILGSGALLAARAARVFGTHPRLLAAQRELFSQRFRRDGPRSHAELRAAIDDALERLRRRALGPGAPRPRLVAALDRAGAEARDLGDQLDHDLVRRARRDLRLEPGAPLRVASEQRAEESRARLEAFRLALAEVEIQALVDPGRFEERGTEDLETARRLLLPIEEAPQLPPAPAVQELAPAMEARPAHGTADQEARHLYLKGRFLWNKRTPADVNTSIDLYREAIGRDPSFALAHAGIADAFLVLGYYGQLAPGEAFPRARESARRALEIDADLAEAHCSLAFVRMLFDWDWAGAEKAFQRSFELDADYATAHHWYAELLSFQERHDEAIVEARRAVELDPLSRILRTILAWALFYARRYEEAISQLEEALVLDPSFAPAELWLGLAYEQTGDLERGLEVLERASADSGQNPMARAGLCRIYGILGRTREADGILERLVDDAHERYVPAYHLATLYGGRGDLDRAFEELERARRARDNWLVFLRIDPAWDGLRTEPRFLKLLRAVGLER